jgi:hypothetical protein
LHSTRTVVLNEVHADQREILSWWLVVQGYIDSQSVPLKSTNSLLNDAGKH